MLHVVLRPLPGPEGPIPSGTLVEPTTWRNLKTLVDAGILRPVTPDDNEGMETLEVDGNGISETNIFDKDKASQPKPKSMKIGKKR